MSDNNNWEGRNKRAQEAQNHTKVMEQKYAAEIQHSVDHSKIYSGPLNDGPYLRKYYMSVKMTKLDSVSAILKTVELFRGKTAVLNFASYKEPGGKFLQGSKAQEECLCHESFLFNVLSKFEDKYYSENRENLNRALYSDKAIYSPEICFFRNDIQVHCDVITCAAPNYSAASKYCNIKEEENLRALESRIRFILDIAAKEHVDNLILGAFGCGVFGQDPEEVGKLFGKYLRTSHYCFKKVIFAVIPGGENYEKMKKGLCI